MLDECKDFKGNDKKQNDLFQSFRCWIQCLFIVSEYYVYDHYDPAYDETTFSFYHARYCSIFEMNLDYINNWLNLKSKYDYTFIDLNDNLIKNEQNLKLFWDTMRLTHHGTDEMLRHQMQYPWIDAAYEGLVVDDETSKRVQEYEKQHEGVKLTDFEKVEMTIEIAQDRAQKGIPIKFDAVPDIFAFLGRKWNLKLTFRISL